MIYPLLKSVTLMLNITYEFCPSDLLRKSLGYVPIIWMLIDNSFYKETGIKKESTRTMAILNLFMILIEFLISYMVEHFLTILAIIVATSIAGVGKICQPQINYWIKQGYFVAVFPGINGIKETRLLILLLCTVSTIFCCAIKYISISLLFKGLLLYYILYLFLGEKGFSIVLAIITQNWPLLVFAFLM